MKPRVSDWLWSAVVSIYAAYVWLCRELGYLRDDRSIR